MLPAEFIELSVGLIAIGRNEGERLRRCLVAAQRQVRHVVYVDSGSSDGSVEFARSLGVELVALDMSQPFTAARARNAGFERLSQIAPDLEFVQFVDGDCELVPGWIEAAVAHARAHPAAAVVCGRRRERFPEASIYNRLCDIEWDSPVGLARSCGGDALMRATALRRVGGYSPDLIAGEEPDLCRRLRREGFEVWRIDAEMTLHDADMKHFGQWWKRNVRAGHAYAEAWYRERRYGEGTARRQVLSNLVWSLPVAWPAWPALFFRIYGTRRDPAYAAFTVLGKMPQAEGQLRFLSRKLRRARGKLIEYK